jgi:hypothetical protein
MKNLQVKSSGITHGLMVWWNKCEDASLYQVKLYINIGDQTQILATIPIKRNTFYHTFTGLATYKYTVEVIAENREGEVIAEGKTSHTVEDLIQVYGYTGG